MFMQEGKRNNSNDKIQRIMLDEILEPLPLGMLKSLRRPYYIEASSMCPPEHCWWQSTIVRTKETH